MRLSVLIALTTALLLTLNTPPTHASRYLVGEWTQIGPDGGDMHFVFVTSDHIVFASHGFGGVWRSLDGETYSLINFTGYVDLQMLAMAEVGDKLYGGGNYGLWVSHDRGVTWSRVETGVEGLDSSPATHEVVSMAAGSGEVVYFTARVSKDVLGKRSVEVYHGFFKLVDGQASFTPLPLEASAEVVVTLAYDDDFQGRELLFVSSSKAGLYAYDVESSSWTKILDAQTTRVAVDREHDLVYVGTIGDWYYRAWLEDGEWRTEHITIPDKQCAVASFIAPDPYNPDRLWVGAEGEGGRLYSTDLKGSSFVGVGFWIDGEWADFHWKGNYATVIAIDRHGEGEDPADYTINTPYGVGARIAYVPQGGAHSVMKTVDGGRTWRKAYEGIYGDTINQVTYLESGVLAGGLVVTCVSGNQISFNLGDTWVEGVDFGLGDIGYGLPGYAWGVASPQEELEGAYDLLVATGYPSPSEGGDGLYAVDVDGMAAGSPAPAKRLYPHPCFDVVVVGDVAYVGDMDSGVGVVDLSSYDVSKLPCIPEDEAGMNLLYVDGKLIIWTLKAAEKKGDSFFFANPKALGSIYIYYPSTGECTQAYSGSRVIAVDAKGDEMVALNVERELIHFTGGELDRQVSLTVQGAKFSDMVVDWDLGVVYISVFDRSSPAVLYGFLDEVWKQGAEALHPLGEGLPTNMGRCLELVEGTLFLGTEGLSVWRITPRLMVEAEPPTVEITSPLEGSGFKVGDTIELSFNVKGEADKVEVRVDGENIATLTSPPWTAAWDTSGFKPGAYKVTVIASGPAGSASDTITITLTAPTSGPQGPSSQQPQQPRPSRCIIATVTYGSELAPEVQLLRGFRDNIAMKTLAGQAFMNAFHSWYYTWSPYVANQISRSQQAKNVVKTLITPLIATLHLATYVYYALSASPEVAIVTAGIVACTLLGLIYLLPILSASYLVAWRLGWLHGVKQPKLLGTLWVASLLLTALAIAGSMYSLAMASTSMLVVVTMALTAKASLWAVAKIISSFKNNA